MERKKMSEETEGKERYRYSRQKERYEVSTNIRISSGGQILPQRIDITKEVSLRLDPEGELGIQLISPEGNVRIESKSWHKLDNCEVIRKAGVEVLIRTAEVWYGGQNKNFFLGAILAVSI